MLKNYTTKIPATQTVGEIQGILAAHGARKVMMDYSPDGHVSAVSFAVETPCGMRGFSLPARVDAVAATLAKQRTKCDYAQAERVAWRIVKDWIDAQMAFLESEQVAFEEIFLPYMVDNSGRTLYQAFQQNQLTTGTAEEDASAPLKEDL